MIMLNKIFLTKEEISKLNVMDQSNFVKSTEIIEKNGIYGQFTGVNVFIKE
jgi:hypothetical protein